MRHLRDHKKGFTLIELLIALIITSVILTAAVTMAYAFDSAYDAGDDTSQKQAQIRYAYLRIQELIRNCKLICSYDGYYVGIWRDDDNGDGQINVGELVYIGSDGTRDQIRLVEFSKDMDDVVQLSTLGQMGGGWWNSWPEPDCTTTVLIQECGNVHVAALPAPPYSNLASVSFDLEEAGVTHYYQTSAAVRSPATHLLDETGTNIVSDDDESVSGSPPEPNQPGGND